VTATSFGIGDYIISDESNAAVDDILTKCGIWDGH
jgi:hypothetical protein